MTPQELTELQTKLDKLIIENKKIKAENKKLIERNNELIKCIDVYRQFIGGVDNG